MLATAALQHPTLLRQPQCRSASMHMCATEIARLEASVAKLEAEGTSSKELAAVMDELFELKVQDLAPGSNERTAIVIEFEQRAEAQRRRNQQAAAVRGDAFVRERADADRAAAAAKQAAVNAEADRKAAALRVAAREAADRKRAQLLGVVFASADPTSSSLVVASSSLATVEEEEALFLTMTDAALDVLFGSGYDAEGGGGGGVLTNAELQRMQGVIAATSTALRRNGEDASLLLRRAALLVALGRPALARADYEKVLELDPANEGARKYFERKTYGGGFDPYEILGVPRDADADAISMAFRQLAKQWHPDRWVAASEAEQLEAETRFKQLNLAQGVLTDAAKRRKYDAGTASVADLMIGWWEKMAQRRKPKRSAKLAAGSG